MKSIGNLRKSQPNFRYAARIFSDKLELKLMVNSIINHLKGISKKFQEVISFEGEFEQTLKWSNMSCKIIKISYSQYILKSINVPFLLSF